MISKVKEYEELYTQFNNLYGAVYKIEKPISDIKAKIQKLNDEKKKVNYMDPTVVVGYMQSYVDDQISKKKCEISTEVSNELSRITNRNGKIQKIFISIFEWISGEKVKDIASKSLNIEEEIDLKNAENAGAFGVFSMINKIFSLVFRLDFLKFFPKVLRVISAVIVWGIVLVPNMIKLIRNRFNREFRDYLFSLPSGEYEKEAEIVFKKFVNSCVIEILAVIVLLIAINIIVYCITRYQAKQYIIRNSAVCLALLDPKEFEKKLYDQNFNSFTNTSVATWKQEMECIKRDGISSEISENPHSLYSLVKVDLQKKYDEYNSSINLCNTQIDGIKAEAAQAREKIEQIKPRIVGKKKEVNAFITDTNYNEGVLTPYVSAGFSIYDKEGINNIAAITHRYSPVFICYDDETANNIDKFKKRVELVIERLMLGFFQENSHKFMELHLVDFEGLHFPASRTMDRMQVLHTQQELSSYYDMLKEKREIIYSLPVGDGRINNINPGRLEKRENPIKYNIAFFVGVDFTSLDKEISQLYSVAENIGFIPFIFMRKSVALKLLEEEEKAFSRVIKRIKAAKLMYSFESVIWNLEYQMMVSNQKELLDQRVPVNTIISIEELANQLYSMKRFPNADVLYVDTKDLPEDLYDLLQTKDHIRFFTLNNNVPSFVTKEVKKF